MIFSKYQFGNIPRHFIQTYKNIDILPLSYLYTERLFTSVIDKRGLKFSKFCLKIGKRGYLYKKLI